MEPFPPNWMDGVYNPAYCVMNNKVGMIIKDAEMQTAVSQHQPECKNDIEKTPWLSQRMEV